MTEPGAIAPLDGLQVWAETLGSLATPERGGKLVDVLRRGDRAGLEELLGPRIFQLGGCIDIVRTMTAIVNFGRGHYAPQCQPVQTIRPFRPSQTDGRLFQFPDGTINFVTDAEWWDYYDRAAREPGWSAENQALFVALGILVGCEVLVWTPDEELVSITQTIPICFPTVVNPYEAGDRSP
jgi:hypothetical protein